MSSPAVINHPQNCTLNIYIQLPHDKKVYSKCKNFKLLEEYYKHKTTTDGKRGNCKSCYKEVQKEYYNNNKEKLLQSNKNIIKIIENKSEKRRKFTNL